MLGGTGTCSASRHLKIVMPTTFVPAEAYADRNVEVVPWSTPPDMNSGTPFPAISVLNDSLFIAYVCHNPEFPGWDTGETVEHPGFDIYSAVVRFSGVVAHYLGSPTDEALYRHPLYSRGLKFYAFHEVLRSPKAANPLRHWIATFHDETFEVVALAAEVYRRRVEGEDTQRIADLCASELSSQLSGNRG